MIKIQHQFCNDHYPQQAIADIISKANVGMSQVPRMKTTLNVMQRRLRTILCCLYRRRSEGFLFLWLLIGIDDSMSPSDIDEHTQLLISDNL